MTKVVQADSRNQVQKIFETLHRHSDIISNSLLTGGVLRIDDATQKGVAALLGIHAITPLEDGVYQINPLIKSFLSTRLAQYSAMQSLTRISDYIKSCRALFRDLVEMRQSADDRDKEVIEESITSTIHEIVYFMDQNLRLLNHQTSTDYGNVESFRRKLSQNEFYRGSIKTLIGELDQLNEFSDTVDRESLAYGLHDIRQMVNARIRTRMSDWREQLNDVQAIISKRLFNRRLIDHDLKTLYDTVLWMVQNPTLDGFDLEISNPHPSLLKIEPIRIRARFDINSNNITQDEVLQRIASQLPAPSEIDAPRAQKVKHVVKSSTVEVIETVLNEEDLMLEELLDFLQSPECKPTEISQWQKERRQAAGVSEEAWLLYATHQLNLKGIITELQMTRDADTFNSVFDDVMAFTL